MFTFFRRHPKLLTLTLFLICVLTAFAMRTHNFNREARAVASIIRDAPPVRQNFFGQFLPVSHENFMPFTVECAMMYGYIQDIAAGKGVSSVDPNLHGLEDIAPYRQMIMGLEWFLGWGYRLKSLVFPDSPPTRSELRFQDNIHLAQWVSFQLRLWISLSSGFIFLLLLTLKCRRSLAFFGGIFHAVAISAIARSTGQDIIRGNFALPLISAFLLLLYSSYLRGTRWKYGLLFLVAFTAFSTWDLCLGFFSALVLFELGRWLIGGKISDSRRKAWLVVGCAVVLSSVLVPFNQTYQTIMSPLVVVLLPLLCAAFWKRRLPFARRLLLLVLLGGVLYGFWNWGVKTPLYVSHYSHFSELTAAKIRFNNVKPRDPDKLSYDARMMWTPAMHSADWKIIVTYFPSLGILTGGLSIFKAVNDVYVYTPFSLGLFYLLLLGAPFFAAAAGYLRRDLPRSLFFFVFTFVFTVGFIYVVRYHEFLILFLAVSLPLLLDDLSRAIRAARRNNPAKARRRFLATARFLLGTACFLLITLEMMVSLFGRRVYSDDVRLRETATLIEWFRRENIHGKCVITDFSVGPMLKCYANAAIALQPQFGLERIRRPTQKYLNLLYHGSERDLAEFCSKLNADFLLYNHGYAGPMSIYSDRYIAGAKVIRGTSPVNMMKYNSNKLLWFYQIDPPREFRSITGVYSVFRVIKPNDRVEAMKLCFMGDSALQDGNTALAERCARASFLLDPVSEQTRVLYFKVFGKLPELGLNGIR